jgi:hypothetical protein
MLQCCPARNPDRLASSCSGVSAARFPHRAVLWPDFLQLLSAAPSELPYGRLARGRAKTLFSGNARYRGRRRDLRGERLAGDAAGISVLAVYRAARHRTGARDFRAAAAESRTKRGGQTGAIRPAEWVTLFGYGMAGLEEKKALILAALRRVGQRCGPYIAALHDQMMRIGSCSRSSRERSDARVTGSARGILLVTKSWNACARFTTSASHGDDREAVANSRHFILSSWFMVIFLWVGQKKIPPWARLTYFTRFGCAGRLSLGRKSGAVSVLPRLFGSNDCRK